MSVIIDVFGRVGKRIDGDDPHAHLLADAQIALDDRAGRRDDAGIERPDEQAQQIHGRNKREPLAASARGGRSR